MDCVTDMLSAAFDKLLAQAEAISTAMERSQSYWHAMLDELPTGCHTPLPSRALAQSPAEWNPLLLMEGLSQQAVL